MALRKGARRRSSGPPAASSPLRLNKYLAECGIASRRKADEMITDGAVQVNGKTVFELGVRVEPEIDRITVNGKPVKIVTRKIYVIFYKPENVLTTMEDPEGRPTVADFMEKLPVRVFPVGRLDWDTEGMLLLSNDGDFAQKVMHPREQIPKTYLAKLDGKPTPAQIEKLRTGVTIPGGRVKALHVERIKLGDSENYEWIKIIIGEGKNRQVRHMFNKIGYDVKKLKRVAIGQLSLGPLRKGDYAFLDEGSLAKIFKKRAVAPGTSLTKVGTATAKSSSPGKKRGDKNSNRPRRKKTKYQAKASFRER